MNIEEWNKKFSCDYIQQPISFLTDKNLDRLQQHCEKTIVYASGRVREEHQITLELIERYKELSQELEKEKEKNKEIKIIVNKLMPLAECSYWNYKNHTCSHTCRRCDNLNDDNKRTSSGILIDKDRYCRLYEDGYTKEDTKFVNIEDLIKRHLRRE